LVFLVLELELVELVLVALVALALVALVALALVALALVSQFALELEIHLLVHQCDQQFV
jgi:hypothetical protein